MQTNPSMLPVPSVQLIQRARQGDPGSVSWLYERFQSSIFRYLFYRVGERQTAEDLTSEAFLRMLRSLPGYQPQAAPFQAWLFQIARNLAIDHFRRKDQPESLTENFQSADLAPETAVEQTLTHEQLRQALSLLGDEQQEVIVLRFLLGLPIAQVAQMLHKSEDAIKGLQRRGLMALREAMGDR